MQTFKHVLISASYLKKKKNKGKQHASFGRYRVKDWEKGKDWQNRYFH